MKIIKGTRGCVFCKQSALDELDFGELKVTKNLRAHYYCLLFSESITQSGRDDQGILGFLPSDILSELCRSKKKQCHYCKEFGATAGCANKFCNTKFHLTCAIEKKTQQDFNSFNSYCHKHRKASNVPARMRRAISDYQCVICLENFHAKVNMRNVIWADCCKAEILLHLQCMKKLALSAGYFTKCPGCNNKTDFITTIKKQGVFVPERDASWELASNAYSELYYIHETCDTTKCLCPHGRKFSLERGKWKMFLCKLCGSSGTHQSCSKVQKEFVCSICNVVDDNSSPTNSLTNNDETNTACCSSTAFVNFNDNFPVLHKATNTNSTQEDDDYVNVETIDPMDDIIVVDWYDDDDDDDSIVENKGTDLTVLSRISNEVTIKSSVGLNRPTTSKVETKIPLPPIVRKVATKSTTKLPYPIEKYSVFQKDMDTEEKIINNIIFPQSSRSEDSDNKSEMSKDFVKHGISLKHERNTTTEKFKSKFSHSHKERKIATKSTTKLPFIKKECSDLENTIKLEKQTINSLDDLDDVIVIDSDTEENDIEESNHIAKSEENLITVTETIIERKNIERKVALKSTTKPPLKRKYNNDENTPLEQYDRHGSGSSSTNKIIKHNNIVIPSVERPAKQFRRCGARMGTTQKSTPRLCNLIKKVHTVIGNQSLCERNNFSFERDPLVDVKHPTDEIEAVYNEENQVHYSIPLNVDSEIEFVNCPKFSVSGQVYNKRKSSRCQVM